MYFAKNGKKIFLYSNEQTFDDNIGFESVQTLKLPHQKQVKAFTTFKIEDGAYSLTYKVDNGQMDLKATLDNQGHINADYAIMGKQGKLTGIAKNGKVDLKGNLDDLTYSLEGTASKTPEKSMTLKVSLHVTNYVSV